MTRPAKHEEVMQEQPKKEARTLVPVRDEPLGFPQNLMERIDQIFGERFTPLWSMLWRPEVIEIPPVDVYEEEGQIVVKAELPGLKKEEISIEVTGDLVTLSGKKEKEEKVEKKDYYRYERSAGAFSRTVELPAQIEVEKATAHLEGGVLVLKAPKATVEKPKAKKIEVR